MVRSRLFVPVFLAVAMSVLSACASLSSRDPPQVTVAGIEPMEGQGMEVRMLVKLRVQNPNDSPIDYNGVSLEMNVQGKSFASGVSAESGTVPRFGEAVIGVPMTISAFRMIRQAIGMMEGDAARKIQYEMKGKLNGSGFSTQRFSTKGDFNLPAGAAPASTS